MRKIEWRRNRAAKAIVALLASSKKPLTISAIMQEMHFEHQVIHDCLKSLVSQGILAKSGSGFRGSPFLFMLTSAFYLSVEGNDKNKVESEGKLQLSDESEYVELTI